LNKQLDIFEFELNVDGVVELLYDDEDVVNTRTFY
jgi:hypothetical protein